MRAKYHHLVTFITILLAGYIAYKYGSWFFVVGHSFVDLFVYYLWARHLGEGTNPFHEMQWTAHLPPLVFPGQTVFIIPMTWLPYPVLAPIMLVLNISLVTGLFFLTRSMVRWGAFGNVQAADRYGIWLCLLLLSQPTQMAMHNVQLSVLASFMLLVALAVHSGWGSGVFLGGSAAIKYSLTPLFGVALLFKRRYVTCVVAAIVLLILAAVPLVFYSDILGIYRDYFIIVFNDVTGSGYNTFQGGGGYDLLPFEFLRFPLWNLTVKLGLFALFMVAAFRERKNEKWNLPFLLLISIITCSLVYHRVHDELLAVLFLIFIAQHLFMTKQWGHFCGAMVLILLLDIPQEYVSWAAMSLGRLEGLDRYVYLFSFQEFVNGVPLEAMLAFVIAVYSIYFYFCGPMNIAEKVDF